MHAASSLLRAALALVRDRRAAPQDRAGAARRRRLDLGGLRPPAGHRLGRPPGSSGSTREGYPLPRRQREHQRRHDGRRPRAAARAARAAQAGDRRHRARRQRRAARRQARDDARQSRRDGRGGAGRRREGADRRHEAAAQLRPRVRARVRRAVRRASRRRARCRSSRSSSRASARTSSCSSPTASIRPRRRSRCCSTTSGPTLAAAAARGDERRRAPPRAKVGIDALARMPDRIDVRSPSEFADDHVPGAINLPVLDDAERARVGTLHAQSSAFAAQAASAPRSSRATSRASLETHCRDKPRDWAPLVYCWRGGQRSGSLAHVLNEIGWRAVQLEGGYRDLSPAGRRAPRRRCRRAFAIASSAASPARARAGCSRALADEGAQVLDLEALARHRGSLLGDLPDAPQPSQKAFDSRAARRARRASIRRARSSSSRRAARSARCRCRDALLAAMRAAPCVRVDTPQPLRVALLKEEYAHFLADPDALAARLARLVPLHGTQDDRALERRRAAPATWTRSSTSCSCAHYDPDVLRARSSATFRASRDALDVDARRHRRARRCARSRATLDAPSTAIAGARRMTDLRLPHRQRLRRNAARRQSAVRVRGRARPRRRDDAGARAAVQPVGDDVRAAVDDARRRACASSRRRSRCRSPAIRRSAPRTSCATLASAGDRVTLEMKAGVIPVEARRRRVDAAGQCAEAPRAGGASRAELAAMLGLAAARPRRARRCGSTPAPSSS